MYGGACFPQAAHGSRIHVHGIVACLVILLGSYFLRSTSSGYRWFCRRCTRMFRDLVWIQMGSGLDRPALVSREYMSWGAPRNGLHSGVGSEWDHILSLMIGFPWDVLIVHGLPWVLDPNGIRILWDLLSSCMKIFSDFPCMVSEFFVSLHRDSKTRAMKDILKVFVILLVAVFVVPLLWLLVKEIWWLIVPLFAGIELGNAFWVILFVVAIVVIVWALSS